MSIESKWICLVVLINCCTAVNAQLRFVDKTDTNLPAIVHTPNNSMDAKIVDIDKDGDLDIIIAVEFVKNVILLNDGHGHFEDASSLLPDKVSTKDPLPYRYYPYHDSEDVVVADFDKDGLVEIIIVTEDDETNEYYEMNSLGSYDDLSSVLPGTGITNGITSGDIDGDGWMDLVLSNNGQNYLWYNDKGVWKDDTKHRLPQLENVTQDIEFGDYDNDGDLDMLVGNESDNQLLENDGEGNFIDVSDKIFSSGLSEETREADFGDVDGDGDLDIYFANVHFFGKKEPIQRLLINENGKYSDRSAEYLKLADTGGSVDGDFYDIDGDGDLDLITGNGTLQGTDNGLTIALNDGHGIFIDATGEFLEDTVKQLVIDVEVADFNEDGIADIYLSCFRSTDRLLLGLKE